jgi:hypothetical protein
MGPHHFSGFFGAVGFNVVDDDVNAALRQQDGMAAAHAATRAGN